MKKKKKKKNSPFLFSPISLFLFIGVSFFEPLSTRSQIPHPLATGNHQLATSHHPNPTSHYHQPQKPVTTILSHTNHQSPTTKSH